MPRPGRRGRVVRQRPAKPSTPVRFRSSPSPSMQLHLFAGIYVRDFATAMEWYVRLLGAEPLGSTRTPPRRCGRSATTARSTSTSTPSTPATPSRRSSSTTSTSAWRRSRSAGSSRRAGRRTRTACGRSPSGIRTERDRLRRRPGVGGRACPTSSRPRALNRALLQRQGLLERGDGPALAWVERLVGLQAQEPPDPYVGLWSRIRDLDPLELSDALGERRAVRASLMRGTIHLVSARDCLGLHPRTQPLLNRVWRSGWEKRLNGRPSTRSSRPGGSCWPSGRGRGRSCSGCSPRAGRRPSRSRSRTS